MKLTFILIFLLSFSSVGFGDSLKPTDDEKKTLMKMARSCKRKLKCIEKKTSEKSDSGIEKILWGREPVEDSELLNGKKIWNGLTSCKNFDTHRGKICENKIVHLCGAGKDEPLNKKFGCDIGKANRFSEYIADSYNISDSPFEVNMSDLISKMDKPSSAPSAQDCLKDLPSSSTPLMEEGVKQSGNTDVDDTKEGFDSKEYYKNISITPIRYGVQRDYFLGSKDCNVLFGENFFQGGEGGELKVTDSSNSHLCRAYASKVCSSGENSPQKRDEIANCFDEEKNPKFQHQMNALVLSCESIHKIYQRASMTNNEDGEAYYATVDAQGPPQRQGQNTEPHPSQLRFAKGGFACIKSSGMTLDYLSCKKAAQAFNASLVGGDMIGEMANKTVSQIRTADAQGKNLNGGFEGGLKAQSDMHNIKADEAMMSSVNQGAQAAWGVKDVLSYVKPKTVKEEWCEDGEEDNNYKIPSIYSCMGILMLKNNDFAVKFDDDTSLMKAMFQNQLAIRQISRNTGINFAQSLVSSLIAGMHRDQADMSDQVLEAWETANFNQPDSGMEMTSLCGSNPNLPQCNGFKKVKMKRGGGLDINFGAPNGGSQIDYENDVADSGFNVDENEPLTGKEYDDLTNIMGDAVNKGSRDIQNRIGASSVSTGRRPGSGGGGGGGGGGGAAASGGSPGSGKRRAAMGRGGSTVPKEKYVTGMSGKYRKGSGSKGRKKSSNAFDRLLGNRSGRRIASKVNKDILPKNIRLFTAISKRYSKVNESGRLEKTRDNELGL